MAAPDTSQDGLASLAKAEHNSAGKAKRIQIRGIQPSDGEYYNVSVRVLGSTPAINTAIVDGSGNHITSFGGGTQYTEGDTDASITGTALMFEGAGNALVAATGDATNGLDVDVTRSALPTGASTSANQTTIIGHIDGIEGLLTTIDSDTSNLSVVGGGTEAAAIRVTIANDSTGVLSVDDNGGSLTVDNAGLTELAAAIDTEVQVDVVAALPAGTNAIGKLTQPATPTLANVTMTGLSVTLQASNTARRNLMIFNDSGVTIYVKLGITASATSFTVKMVDQAYYELPDPVYTGIVTALGASGDVRVTEVT